TTVGTVDPAATTARELASLMVGGTLPVPELRESTVTDETVLELDGLRVEAADGRPVVDGVALRIRRGEIVGIAGVEGNGQAELIEAVMGIRPIAAGRVLLRGTDVTGRSTREIREAGVGFIPEDRHRQGLLLEAPLWENRILGHQRERPNARGVRTPAIYVLAAALCGGNQRKLIVGRERSGDPALLLAARPTRRVDVGAQAAIWDHLREARAAGLAVLLVSAALDELIGMSDT